METLEEHGAGFTKKQEQVFREHHHPITSRLLTTTTSTSPTTPQEDHPSERGLSLSSVSSCPRRRRRTSSPGRARREGEKEEEKEEHPHRPSSLAIVPVRRHQKKTIIVATSSLILFTSSLSSVLASSLPLAIKTIGSINHLYSKVSTISSHFQHLEGHLLGISSWSISNICCSSCWNISNSIKPIFSKMAGASSVEASQMDILEATIDNEDQQIIEDSQPAEGEAASPTQERPSSARPPKSAIKTEREAKIHIVDTIIYDILSSDSTYHTPPSETIRKIYDSFSVIMTSDGVDLSTAMSDYSLITLIEFMKQSSVDKSSTPWDLSHQSDPISVFTVLDNINYERFIRTGSIILEGIDDAMPYVHRHPHLFQSPLPIWQPSTSASSIMLCIASAEDPRTIRVWFSPI